VNYTELKDAILGWLARPGDPLLVYATPGFITLFETEAGRRLKTAGGERLASLLAAGGIVALPSDMTELRGVSIAGRALEYMPPDRLPVLGGESWCYTILGTSLVLGPATAVTVDLLYQAGIPPLSDAAPSNWLIEQAPDAYLFGSLCQAEAYIGHDERVPLWMQQREAAFAGIELADRKYRWGGPLQIRVDGISVARRTGGGAGVPVVTPLPGGGTSTNVHIGETAPIAPVAGDLWWDSSSTAGGGQLYVYYIDPTGPGQWVAATNQQVGAAGMVSLPPASGDTVTVTSDTPNVYISSGALAALTIRLPASPPLDRQVQIGFANPVETLTVQDSLGAAVAGAPTSAYGPGAALLFRWVPPWVYWK
jgi:hypothetical protein